MKAEQCPKLNIRTETENLEQPGYQGSIYNRTAEIENETAEAETERFQQLCKQSNTELKCRNGNWQQDWNLKFWNNFIAEKYLKLNSRKLKLSVSERLCYQNSNEME